MTQYNKILMSILGVYSLSLPAFAQTSSNNFQVASTLNGTCNVSVADMDFGIINSNQDTLVDRTVNVLCSKGIFWQASFTTGSSGIKTQRTLLNNENNAEKLNYNLYMARGTNLGSVLGDNNISATGQGINQTFIIRGKVPAGQYVTPGTYSDAITVNINH